MHVTVNLNLVFDKTIPSGLSIYIASNLSSELFHVIYLSNKSIGSLSSHSNFRCQNSWISNFASSNPRLTIYNGSRMKLTQLSKPRFVFSKFLESDWNFGPTLYLIFYL